MFGFKPVTIILAWGLVFIATHLIGAYFTLSITSLIAVSLILSVLVICFLYWVQNRKE